MLTRSQKDGHTEPRRLSRERRLWHDGLNTPSFGCGSCPEFELCGGLRVAAPFFDCLNYCCGSPATCHRVCRNHGDFAARVREVGRFFFDNVPRGPVLPSPLLPHIVPLLFHGKRRARPLRGGVVALSLYSLFDREGRPRFASHEELCRHYVIEPGTRVVLTGTDRDAPLERWWALGAESRGRIIRSLSSLGVILVTTPNYSVFSDVPRWSDLHAMKRIAITHQEFLAGGVPVALHVNGRTDSDFQRWSRYVASRPEVTHLAYEFTTGTRWPGRREQHAKWICDVAVASDRPLKLIVRGGAEVMPALTRHFAQVTVLNATVFMKTMNRQRAVSAVDGSIRWEAHPTLPGELLDQLLRVNLAAITGLPKTALVATR
jgi:hypothetical protein